MWRMTQIGVENGPNETASCPMGQTVRRERFVETEGLNTTCDLRPGLAPELLVLYTDPFGVRVLIQAHARSAPGHY